MSMLGLIYILHFPWRHPWVSLRDVIYLHFLDMHGPDLDQDCSM